MSTIHLAYETHDPYTDRYYSHRDSFRKASKLFSKRMSSPRSASKGAKGLMNKFSPRKGSRSGRSKRTDRNLDSFKRSAKIRADEFKKKAQAKAKAARDTAVKTASDVVKKAKGTAEKQVETVKSKAREVASNVSESAREAPTEAKLDSNVAQIPAEAVPKKTEESPKSALSQPGPGAAPAPGETTPLSIDADTPSSLPTKGEEVPITDALSSSEAISGTPPSSVPSPTPASPALPIPTSPSLSLGYVLYERSNSVVQILQDAAVSSVFSIWFSFVFYDTIRSYLEHELRRSFANPMWKVTVNVAVAVAAYFVLIDRKIH